MFIEYSVTHDYASLIPLWRESFGDDAAAIAEFYSANCVEAACAAYDGGVLVSALNLIPVSCGGRSGYYVYAACTAEKYRKKGIFRSLSAYADGVMEAAGAGFAFLIPAEEELFAMYEKLGYSAPVGKKVCRAPLENFAEMSAGNAGERLISAYGESLESAAANEIVKNAAFFAAALKMSGARIYGDENSRIIAGEPCADVENPSYDENFIKIYATCGVDAAKDGIICSYEPRQGLAKTYNGCKLPPDALVSGLWGE